MKPSQLFLCMFITATGVSAVSSKAQAFCTNNAEFAPYIYSMELGGRQVCRHISGFVLAYFGEKVPKEQAGVGCAELTRSTGLQWFLPNQGDINARIKYGQVAKNALYADNPPVQSTDTLPLYWHSAVPQTATFNFDKNILTNKVLPTATFQELRRAGDVVGTFSRQRVQRLTEFLANGRTGYFCLAKKPATAEEIAAAVDPLGPPAQIKGVLEKKDGLYQLRPHTLSDGKSIAIYSEDGLTLLGVTDLRLPGEIIQGRRVHFDIENLAYDLDNKPEIQFLDIDIRFAGMPLILDPVGLNTADLDRYAAEKRIVMFRGRHRQLLNRFEATSHTLIDVRDPDYFAFCQAETRHFRSTRQGCAYFPNPDSNQASIWLSADAYLLTTPGAQLKKPLDSFKLYDGLLTDLRQPVFGQSINSVRSTTLTELILVCGFGGCATFASGYDVDLVLSTGQTVGEVIGNSSKTFVLPARAVSSYKAAQTYSQRFPDGLFPAGFNFKFAQKDAEIEFLRTNLREVAHALTPAVNLNAGTLFPTLEYVVKDIQFFDTAIEIGNISDVVVFPEPTPTAEDTLNGVRADGSRGSYPTKRVFYELGRNDARGIAAFGLSSPDDPKLTSRGAVEDTIFTLLTSSLFPADKFESPTAVARPERDCSIYETNPLNPFDTNQDGRVTAIDALAIINELNVIARIPRQTRSVNGICPAKVPLDVNGDQRVSASDALGIINYLNRLSTGAN